MALSTFSYVVSALEFLAAISLLASPAKSAEWFLKLKEDDKLLRLVGALFFVLGFLVLTRGVSIGAHVEGLVRLAAWLGVIKSLIICWFPRHFAGLVGWIFSRPVLLRPYGLIALAAGVLFLLAGRYLQSPGV
jgi:uncharacterized protein YjeT (DUF2065 family)